MLSFDETKTQVLTVNGKRYGNPLSVLTRTERKPSQPQPLVQYGEDKENRDITSYR